MNWEKLLQIRGEIHKHLESMRNDGIIGKSEDACLTLRVDPKDGLIDSSLFKTVCRLGDVFFEQGENFAIVESKSLRDDPEYVKCPRCQLYYGIYTRPPNYDNLCDRCCRVLVQGWPEHPSVPLIKEKLRVDNEKRMK